MNGGWRRSTEGESSRSAVLKGLAGEEVASELSSSSPTSPVRSRPSDLGEGTTHRREDVQAGLKGRKGGTGELCSPSARLLETIRAVRLPIQREELYSTHLSMLLPKLLLATKLSFLRERPRASSTSHRRRIRPLELVSLSPCDASWVSWVLRESCIEWLRP